MAKTPQETKTHETNDDFEMPQMIRPPFLYNVAILQKTQKSRFDFAEV